MAKVTKVKEVSTEIPDGNYAKWGFGTFPVLWEWEVRNASVQKVLGILDGDKAAKNNDTLAALSIVKDLFASVYSRDRRDWFTVCKQLAFPGHDMAKEIALTIGDYRSAIANDDVVGKQRYFSKLLELPVPEMLEHFVDLNVNGKHPIDENEFAYILWSQSKANEFFVGATTRSIDGSVSFVGERFPENSPYGVVGAYLVHDALEAREALKGALEDLYAYRGLYKACLEEIRERVEEVLKENHLLRSSPWDGAENESELTDTLKATV